MMDGSVRQGDDRIRVAVAGVGPFVETLSTLLGRTGDLAVRPITEETWVRGEAPQIVLLAEFSAAPSVNLERVFPDEYLKRVQALIAEPLALGEFPVPLIVTSTPALFTCAGLEFPPELIFGVDLKAAGAATAPALASRIRCLAKTWCPRFHPELMRDFLVARLRVALGIGETHHDVMAEFEGWLRDMRKWAAGGIKSDEERKTRRGELDGRIATIHALAGGTSGLTIYGVLFQRALEFLISRLSQIGESMVREERRSSVDTLVEQLGSLERAFPARNGSAVSIVALTRPWVLVIDDEAVGIVEELKRQAVTREDCGLVLDDICRFVPFTKWRKPFSQIREELEQFLTQPDKFRNVRCEDGDQVLHDVRAIDYILLDLSFGESGRELGGLELLRLLRTHCHETPIIIHSTYGHASHVISAIENGANWFSRKDRASRLANAMHSLHNRMQWEKEWEQERTAQGFTGDSATLEQLDKEHRYIVHKLLANVAGDTIEVRKITGGIGGAKTLHTRKSKGADSDMAPVVVKLAQPFEMASEALRYRRFIYPYIDNLVGRVDRPLVRAGRSTAGIAYTFAGSYQGMSGTGRQARSVSLRDVLRQSVTARPDLPFSHFRPLFERLFGQVISRLHRAKSIGGAYDFPNVLLDETRSPRESFAFRMPPRWELEVTEVSEAAETTMPAEIDAENVLTLHNVYVSELNLDNLVVSGRDADGGIYRARLIGEVAAFVAQYFVIRPHKHLTVRGRICREAADIWRDVLRGLPDPSGEADPVAAIPMLLEAVPKGPIAIVHGDLNLGNIMVEVEEKDISRLLDDTPWLIDFARTRRDTIAHDFATLETSLATELLAATFVRQGQESEARLAEFFTALQRSAFDVPEWVESSPPAKFVFDAISMTRAAAAAAGVTAREYLATVALYYLVVLKVITPRVTTPIEPAVDFKRVVAFQGAIASLPAVLRKRSRARTAKRLRTGQNSAANRGE